MAQFSLYVVGGAPIASWVYRACIIQGTQQIYVTALWYWGTSMAIQTQAGTTQVSLVDSNPGLLTGIGVFVAVLMWGVGAMIYYGLPDYYRQAPGKVPAFYKSLFHRKIIVVCSCPYSSSSIRGGTNFTAVVLLCSSCSKLLALGSVWAQLALPLVQSACCNVANYSSCNIIFYWSLGSTSLVFQHVIRLSRLDTPYLRHRLRRPEVVSNALGDV
jgi:hypothetical protein